MRCERFSLSDIASEGDLVMLSLTAVFGGGSGHRRRITTPAIIVALKIPPMTITGIKFI
jgi:hypothetical protein